jgi:hypothetical protein
MNARSHRFDVLERRGRLERWSIVDLIGLAKQPDVPEWTPERRERLYQRVLVRAAQERARRRALRAFTVAAVAVLAIALLVKAIPGDA